MRTLKPKKRISKSILARNNGVIVLCLIFTVIITVPVSLALTTSDQSSNQANILPAPQIEIATPQTQVHVQIAYAYVGPAPFNVSSYVDNSTKSIMRLTTQYPSAVTLNITRLPGVQIAGCDAVVEVYGVKIATDNGITEYHAYFVGTNYAPSFSNDSALTQYAIDLIKFNQYGTVTGNFIINWTKNTSILTDSIGSITKYVSTPISSQGLFSAGEPNMVSVTVYRIGYITVINGSVAIHADPSNNSPIDAVQLGNYGNGFLYDDIVPSTQLSKISLFHPISHP